MKEMGLVRSLKWSFLAQVASSAVTPVVFVVLARLLTPEDFGVMTAAVMVIAFSQVFWDAGMSKALIQRQSDVAEAASVAFWVNITLGGLIAIVLFLSAETIATNFFQDSRVAAVLKVMTLQLLLGAFSSVQTAFLTKEMRFKELFWIRLVTVALPGAASIPLAWSGLGYWALVAGTLSGQVVQVLMLWRTSKWHPSWGFRWVIAKEMGRFGAWVGASGVLAWLYLWADSLVVGKFLGTHELGLYRTGNQFAISVFGLAFGPAAPVLYSHLSRMANDRLRIRGAIEKTIRIISVIAVPMAVILFGFSDQIALGLFGAPWAGVGQVIGVLALTHGVAWVVGMNGEVYRAVGAPHYETIVMGVGLLVYIPAYIGAILIGFDVFVWTRFVLAVGATIFHLYLLRSVVGVKIMPVAFSLMGAFAISALLVGGAKWFSLSYISGLWPQLIVGCLLSAASLGAIVYFLERDRLVKDFSRFLQSSDA